MAGNTSMDAKFELKNLDLLACPACLGGLSFSDEGEIICEECGRIYPIEDGIPILLIECAKQKGEDGKLL